MKSLILIFLIPLIISSCGTTVKFPVSTITPSAVISATKKTDKSNNTILSITAKNLASADRLSPAKKTYVVWITTAKNGIKNIGQLNQKNGKTAKLETLTSFNPIQIFITAEDEGNISYPMGTEISRATFK